MIAVVRPLVATLPRPFGITLFPVPAHQTGRADFPRQMWPATFDAYCGAAAYVALGTGGSHERRKESFERHIIRLQGAQKVHQGRLVSPALGRFGVTGRFAFGQGLGLHLEVNLGIDVGSAERDMAKLSRKMHRSGK